MNIRFVAFGIVLAPILLSACAQKAEPDLATVVQVTRESATLRKKMFADCMDDVRETRLERQEKIVRLVGVPRDKFAVTFCNRFIAGYVAGQYTEADMAIVRRGGFPPSVVLALAGR
ncbi:hypothetical protein [Oharaeibacter diazotrophicus]|uniref:Entry exclusion lipoprotein TrbK n=1 Tax=Oharaeibacter diazotrophicus TaxID=1920512 RepID=A0A4R6RD01_9HYPH|nr:hypothetical protein [Oharaeibacter diazotrophicus]TDP84002.1 hypothetical protein EDD54_2605 [Oharaeibacter diazotrophicus]BBE73041.1 hypothetical protein OHA_1_02647 [Pleomorphomonas sp. SM30]GLS74829.1 hypothetical protein GCM10007904_01640 [Oharaeibacter diazotrophicus]